MTAIYNPGDIIGSYGNKLLKITKTTPYGHRYGLFLCGQCHEKTFEAKIYHVSSDKIIRCKECRKKAYSGQNNINFIDLSGKRFGKLTVVRYCGSINKGSSSNGHVLSRSSWECLCDCGRSRIVDSDLLNRGIVSSCGYCSLHSKGEYAIYQVLEKLGLFFLTQYSFEDCVNDKTQAKLKFDFYLPDYNCCIEYDGTSHYTPNKYGSWNTEESVKNTRYRDSIKNTYCKKRGISLIRIPYWDYDKIDKDYLLFLIQSHQGGEVDELQSFSESNRQSC